VNDVTSGPQRTEATSRASDSMWAPLGLPAFRLLWIATVVSNIGTAMQGVAATWLMVSLDPRPTMVAALQAAASLPMFVFGLPAGVLADILDRRRLLMVASGWMMLVSFALAAMAYFGQLSELGLLAGTFALGIGAAMSAPAFQAVVPELASGKLLTPAVALNGIGNNVARTVGPAVGGLFVGIAGTASTFAVNALSTVAVVAALWAWRRAPQSSRLPPEHFLSALRASVRYVSAARGIRVVLARAVLFFAFASALSAVLPLVASQRLGLAASGFGLMLGAIGIGAITGALLLGKLRSRFGQEHLTMGATALAGATTIAMAMSTNLAIACAVAGLFGIGWIVNLTLLNVAVQNSVAGWVRARMLAMYVVTFMGVSTVGSLVWGKLAEVWSIETSLALAGALQVLSVLVVWRIPFVDAGTLDLRAAASSEAPLLLDPDHDFESVLVTVEYRVPVESAGQFEYALLGLENSRRRAGAMAWRHWRDGENETIHREAFAVESWTEYLRLVARKTNSDADIERDVVALLAHDTEPLQRLFRGVKRYTGPLQPKVPSKTPVRITASLATTQQSGE
jgi:MFS family permease